MQGSCPGELQGVPRGSTALAGSTFYPITAHNCSSRCRDSLAESSRGWLAELSALFALFLVIPSALLVCCQGNTATRTSLVAVRTEGVLHLSRDSALVSAPF